MGALHLSCFASLVAVSRASQTKANPPSPSGLSCEKLRTDQSDCTEDDYMLITLCPNLKVALLVPSEPLELSLFVGKDWAGRPTTALRGMKNHF
eukprot:5945988-Amphidinium_carterae.1